MNLRRSTSSLHSLNIFYKADVVVFCEGGTSLGYQQAISMTQNDGTLDSLYWESVINAFYNNKIYHVKSVGNKNTLKLIAEDVKNNNIKSISICMDSDYDRVLGKQYGGPRVVYTMGYSWENDVMSFPVLENLFQSLAGNGASGTAAFNDFRQRTSLLASWLQRWTEIDISCCARGKLALFDRQRPLSVIDMNDPPKPNHAMLAQRLLTIGYKRGPKRVVAVKPQEVTEVCFGKLISRALFHAFKAALKIIKVKAPDYEIFMRLAISETIKGARSGMLPNLFSHLDNQKTAFS
ncbi:MAG: DUF4435 domain-containing protein [Beijerinckiaceae bacterium]|nr:DUF4435 domain-containing protein [Beijerinckiaceae bacterium]